MFQIIPGYDMVPAPRIPQHGVYYDIKPSHLLLKLLFLPASIYSDQGGIGDKGLISARGRVAAAQYGCFLSFHQHAVA